MQPRADAARGVAVAAAVIPAQELAERLDQARADLVWQPATGHDQPAPTLAARAQLFHHLWATVAPPTLEPRRGVKGRVTHGVKRVVRKLGAWYVEPRWTGQREIDAELARFATDSAAAIDELRARVAHLELWNDRLTRELRRSQRAHPGSVPARQMRGTT